MSFKKSFYFGLTCIAASVNAVAETAECETNFTASGSFISGKHYKTTTNSASTTKDDAYKKAYAAVLKGGYQIVSSDKDVGAISAAQSVSYSQGGKSAPLNLLVEPLPVGGTQLTISFSTAGGISASSKDVIKEFCRISNETLGNI